MTAFTRDNKTMYSIPLSFAEKQLKLCPFCRSNDPRWLTKKEWKLFGSEYYFKCSHCDSIIKISQDDVTGLSYTTKSFAGQKKKYKGRENWRIYVCVERIGALKRTKENTAIEGEELPLDELFAITME